MDMGTAPPFSQEGRFHCRIRTEGLTHPAAVEQPGEERSAEQEAVASAALAAEASEALVVPAAEEQAGQTTDLPAERLAAVPVEQALAAAQEVPAAESAQCWCCQSVCRHPRPSPESEG